MVQAGLGKKQHPISKTTRAKRGGGVAQVIECLPTKCKALSSNPRTAKTNYSGHNNHFHFACPSIM
jgi:hypothetical protein